MGVIVAKQFGASNFQSQLGFLANFIAYGRGFYRTATCAFDPSGFTVKRSRSHVVQLRADRGGIELLCRGAAVERRQRGQWVIVDPRDERFVLSGATYRVNQSFVFRVLA